MKTLTKIFKEASYEFSPEEMGIATKTSRAAGAIGAKAIVPRLVAKLAKPEDEILDFGAGKAAAHAQFLNDQGFNVTAYDFQSNRGPLHDENALDLFGDCTGCFLPRRRL